MNINSLTLDRYSEKKKKRLIKSDKQLMRCPSVSCSPNKRVRLNDLNKVNEVGLSVVEEKMRSVGGVAATVAVAGGEGVMEDMSFEIIGRRSISALSRSQCDDLVLIDRQMNENGSDGRGMSVSVSSGDRRVEVLVMSPSVNSRDKENVVPKCDNVRRACGARQSVCLNESSVEKCHRKTVSEPLLGICALKTDMQSQSLAIHSCRSVIYYE